MLAKKLLAIDKIQAFVKQICLLGVICKVFDRKILCNEKFCFLWDLCYQYLNFLLRAIINKDLQVFSKMCAPDQWTEIKGKRVIRRSQSSTSQTFSDLFTHIQLSSGKFTFLASNVRFYIFFFSSELLIGPQPAFLEFIVILLYSDWSTLSRWARLQ